MTVMRSRALVLVCALVCALGSAPGCGSGGSAIDAAPLIDAAPPEPAFVHVIGRFDENNRFAWPGSTIVTRFAGTSLTMELDDSGQNWFSIWIDGVEQPPLEAMPGIRSYVVATGLADGEHDAVIARRTEALFGASQIRGFPGSVIIPTLPPYGGRLIELVGDSITCGYGALGDGPACEFDADTESEPDAWGGLTARALDAGHVAIAYSGKGVYRNYDGGDVDTMPVLYERTLAEDATSWTFAIEPDVVVVNLGTNDFAAGDPGQPFVEAYTAFLAQIRSHYPDAHVIVASSPMLGEPNRSIARGYLEQVVDAAGARVTFLDLAEQMAADGYGCDYHPSGATHQKMADVLVPAIRAVTGW
jgi:lysophospholipase L1-like esterase